MPLNLGSSAVGSVYLGSTLVFGSKFDQLMRAVGWSMWWKLKDAPGATTAADASGNSRTGTYSGDAKPTGSGALTLTSSTAQITIADAAWMDNSSFSVLIAAATSAADDSLFSRASGSNTYSSDGCWLLDNAGGSGNIRFGVTNTGGTSAIVTASAGHALSANTPRLIVGTFTSGTGGVELWVNGTSKGTATLSGTARNGSGAVGIRVGQRDGTSGENFQGWVTNAAYIAGTVLSSGTIGDLYTAWSS